MRKVEYLKDILGNNYIGVKYNKSEIKGFLDKLERHINNKELYSLLTQNQQNRDKGYHISVINVMEYNQLIKKGYINSLQRILEITTSDIYLKGIGKAERNGNITYFIVCHSNTLDEIRNTIGLEPKDFHITIGFDKKDVFGVRKNKIIKNIPSKFENQINNKYNKNDGEHLWLKEINGYPDSLNFDNEDVKIDRKTDSFIIFRIKEFYLGVSLVDDELRVTSFYQ